MTVVELESNRSTVEFMDGYSRKTTTTKYGSLERLLEDADKEVEKVVLDTSRRTKLIFTCMVL